MTLIGAWNDTGHLGARVEPAGQSLESNIGICKLSLGLELRMVLD